MAALCQIARRYHARIACRLTSESSSLPSVARLANGKAVCSRLIRGVRPHMPSFSVRSVFLWKPREDQLRRNLYEERIALWQASDIDEAVLVAEREAQTYASDADVKYLGFCQAYALVEEVGVNGIEVFSLLRESDLEPAQYLDAFFATGGEHERVA